MDNELAEWVSENGLSFETEEEAEQAYAEAKAEWLAEQYAMEDYYAMRYGSED